jgi:opacity protein-like surface antigen
MRTPNQGIITRYAAGLLATGMLIFAAPAALAQDRAQTGEFGVLIGDFGGDTVTGIHGAALDFDSDIAWGITGGYNITNRFWVGGEWTWSSPDYHLTRPLDPPSLINRIDAEADISTILLKFAFNFLEGPITPYVEGGIGWVNVDSNVANGPPTTGCWWDPWWGYMCTSFYDTYSDTRDGWEVGVGIRWDLSDSMAVKGSYGETTVDTNHAVKDPVFNQWRLEFDWKF